MNNDAAERRFWFRCLTLFVLLAGAVYSPVLAGRVPFPADIVLQFPAWAEAGRAGVTRSFAEIGDLVTFCYPFRRILAQSLQDGTLPFWNPYFLSGEPFVANSQSSLFYPLNALYYFLPLPVAWSVALVLRRILAAVFMTLFVRSIGGSRAGAVLSGIIYSCCAFITVWQGQANGDSAIWLPLTCYSVNRLRNDRSRRALSIAGLVFAAPILAGHPETGLNITLVAVALAALLWSLPGEQSSRPFDRKFAAYFILAGLLAIGLASIQMMPTLEWINQIGDKLDEPWPALETWQLKGWVSRDILRNPNSSGVSIPEAASYAGILSLLAASLAPLHHARRHVWFLIFITVVSTAIAFSIEPMNWLVSHTPFFRALRNGRLILVANFGIAALAGLGLSAIKKNELWTARTRIKARLLVAAAFLMIVFLIYKLQSNVTIPAEVTRRPIVSLLLLAAGFLLIEMHLRKWWSARSLAGLVITIAAFDLVSFSYGYTGFARPSEIFPQTAVFDFLREQTRPARFRVAQLDYPYTLNAGVMYGVESIDGYELSMERTRTFLRDFSEDRMDGIFLVTNKLIQNQDRRIDMLNAKYFVVPSNNSDFNALAGKSDRFSLVFDDKHVAVFENRNVLPRAFLVPASGVEIVQGMEAQIARVKDPRFDPQQSVVLSAVPSAFSGQDLLAGASFDGIVQLTENNSSRYTFRVQSSQPAVLVVSQIHYPGWTAFIDGLETAAFDTNYALTGVAVGPGDHEVEVVFRPSSLKSGAILSILSLGILALLYRRP